MSVCVVFTRECTVDAGKLVRYARKAPTARGGREITPLALYGELQGPLLESAGILRHLSIEEVSAWYHSPDYQKALQQCRQSAEYRRFLIAGTA